MQMSSIWTTAAKIVDALEANVLANKQDEALPDVGHADPVVYTGWERELGVAVIRPW
jgi:hypothetical protein